MPCPVNGHAAGTVVKRARANLKSLQTKHSCIGARQDRVLAAYRIDTTFSLKDLAGFRNRQAAAANSEKVPLEHST